MTRGKQGARAALRREDASVQSEITTYQRKVHDLTAEITELRAASARVADDLRADCRRLAAQLHEGVSVELLETRAEVDRQRERGDRAEARQREVQKKWEFVTGRLNDFLVDNFNYTRQDAMVQVVRLLGSDAGGLVPPTMSGQQHRKLGNEGTRRIAIAQGHHRPEMVR